MTLIETENGRKILIDLHIRAAADDPADSTPDVGKRLRERLSRDDKGRLFVDAALLSHPDRDHCAGLVNHFHLGPPDTWSKKDDKIIIREQWSSPIVFRRASKDHPLCDDAEAFRKEAIRRVQYYKDYGTATDGNRILILGEDEDGKTDELGGILVKLDADFQTISGALDQSISLRLLGPLPATSEDEEDVLTKNDSSTILNITMSAGSTKDACRFLTAGDAGVAIWEREWSRHRNRLDWLSYDILLTPHHCSWHALSYDSWSEKGEKAQVSPTARIALSQTRKGANLIASSKPITDADCDPPCVRAKREYEAIAKEANGTFRCTSEYPTTAKPDVMEFEITNQGPRLKTQRANVAITVGSGAIGGQPLKHGRS